MCLLKFTVCLRISYLREFAWSIRLFVGTFIRRLLYRICIGIQIQFLFYHRTKKKHTTHNKKKQIECARVHLSFRPVCVVYISSAVVNSLLRRMHKPIATLMFHFSNVRMHFKIFIYIYFFFSSFINLCQMCP